MVRVVKNESEVPDVATLEEVEGDLTCNQCGDVTRVCFEVSDTWDDIECGLCRKVYSIELRLVDVAWSN
jgi:hypothetical protein